MFDKEREYDADTNGQALLLTASEAARLLHVSEKALWNHTAPRGNQIPAVRFGKTLRYSRAALEQWIAQQLGGQRVDSNG
jgi:excisionase family DNA binding protein